MLLGLAHTWQATGCYLWLLAVAEGLLYWCVG
jgi:hypothetical protein